MNEHEIKEKLIHEILQLIDLLDELQVSLKIHMTYPKYFIHNAQLADNVTKFPSSLA